MHRITLPLLLLAALTFFAGLGRGAITDSDEAFYAESAREMVASGDWLTPHYNYEPRFQKPVLYYWVTAATYVVLGPTEFGARLWAAMAGFGLVLVTAAAGRRWYDESTGLLAGAIVATNFGYFSIGRMALPDLPLTFCITLAIWAALVATLEQERIAAEIRVARRARPWTRLPDQGAGRPDHPGAGHRPGAADRAALDRARRRATSCSGSSWSCWRSRCRGMW